MKKNLKIASIALGLSALVALGLGASNLTAAAQSEAINSFEVLNSAAIRKSAPEGIRFTARISKAQRAEGQRFGMIVMPAESFEGELTVDTENVLDIPAETWVDESVYEEYGFSQDYDYFNAVVAGEDDGNGNVVFPEAYYNLLLTARGYVTDGTTVEYTDTISTRSIAYVAKMAELAGEADSTGVIAKIAAKAEIGFAKEITLTVGATEELKLYIGGVAVEESDKVSVEYASDKAIVSVDENGKLTANKKGTANVTVTVTVNGGETLVKTAKVTVNPPEIVDFDKSLVQKGYEALFTEGKSTTLSYVENEVVGDKTIAKAIKVHSDTTSWGSSTIYAQGHYFHLPASVIEAAAKAGYTHLKVEYYTQAGMRWFASYATGSLIEDGNFKREAYEAASKAISLSKLASGESYLDLAVGYFHNYDQNVYDGTQDVDIYITEMYFYGNADFNGSFISLNDKEKITVGGATALNYVENVTVNGNTFEKAYHVSSETTTSGSSTASNAGHFITVPQSVVAAAVAEGYTHLQMTIYTVSGGKICAWYGGATYWSIDAHATEMRMLSNSMSLATVGTNSMQFLFYHNEAQFIGNVPTDIYITEMVFTGKATGDLVTLNNLYDLTATGATVSYEANANIGGEAMKAFRVHATSTASGSAGAPKVTIAAGLFAKAAASEFTHVRITIYTKCGYKLYSDNANSPQSMQGGRETVAKSNTVDLDLTKYTSSGMNVIFYHNVDFGADVPCDVYITALEFIKK